MKALGFDAYERLSETGGMVPVFREIAADLLTPVSAFLAVSARAERASTTRVPASMSASPRRSAVTRIPT